MKADTELLMYYQLLGSAGPRGRGYPPLPLLILPPSGFVTL